MARLYAPYVQERNEQNLLLFAFMPPDVETFICVGRTDLRKGIDGLAGIVEDYYDLNPYAKAIYCFCGSSFDRIKMICFDGKAFIQMVYRMEKGTTFQWPKPEEPENSKTFGDMWLIDRIGFCNELLEGKPLNEEVHRHRVFKKRATV